MPFAVKEATGGGLIRPRGIILAVTNTRAAAEVEAALYRREREALGFVPHIWVSPISAKDAAGVVFTLNSSK